MNKNQPAKKVSYKKTFKNYNRLRDFIRNVFLYGCRNRKDYLELNIKKSRTYDDFIRILSDCLGTEFIKRNTSGHTKNLSFANDMYQNPYNFLIRTYFNKTLNKNTYCMIIVMQILAAARTPLSTQEINDNVPGFKPYSDVDDIVYNEKIIETLNYTAINRALIDLLKTGLIIKKGKKYSTATNILENLTLSEIKELAAACTFYTNITPVSVPGYYFTDTLKRFAAYKFKYTLNEANYWQYRGCNLIQIVDDEIICVILQAIRNNKNIKFVYRNQAESVTATPIAIASDYPYGRTYLITKQGIIYRIDKIQTITPIEKDRLNVTASGKTSNNKTIDLIFTFTSEDNPREVIFIKDRLEKEAAWMKIDKLSDDCYRYTAQVQDAVKFAPWIRTFHKYVSLGKTSDQELAARLIDDRKKALANYGII